MTKDEEIKQLKSEIIDLEHQIEAYDDIADKLSVPQNVISLAGMFDILIFGIGYSIGLFAGGT